MSQFEAGKTVHYHLPWVKGKNNRSYTKLMDGHHYAVLLEADGPECNEEGCVADIIGNWDTAESMALEGGNVVAVDPSNQERIDVAELATECGDILEDEDEDADEKQDATEVLGKLAKLAEDLGQSNDGTAEDVAGQLENAMNQLGPTLVSESYFEEYIKEYVSDCGYLPSEVPWWLEQAINWSQVAETLKQDYTEVSFDGEDWYIR